MKWGARGAEPEYASPEPLAPLGACPDCGGLESTIVCLLFGWRLNQGGFERFENGARLSCQRCQRIYSVGPRGTFQHHARSLPYSPQLTETSSTTVQQPYVPPLRNQEPVPRMPPMGR